MFWNSKVEILRRFTPQNDSVCHSEQSEESNLIRKRCYSALIVISILLSVLIMNTIAFAHHGGVSSAFGPGAPIETASPLGLGKGRFLIYETEEVISFSSFSSRRFIVRLADYGLRAGTNAYGAGAKISRNFYRIPGNR